MQSNPARIGVLVGLIAIAVALFFVLKDDDSSDDGSTTAAETTTTTDASTTEAPATEITLQNGEPVGGIEEIEVAKGQQVSFSVTSDTAGEVHVHGYEIEKEVEAGSTARLAFPADLDGGYEIEFHLPETEVQIAELTVTP